MGLSTGSFHVITIRPSTDAAWSSVSPYFPMPAAAVDNQVNGLSTVVYCLDAPTGWLLFPGTDQVTGLVDALLSTVSAPLASNVFQATDASQTVFVVSGAGTLYVYYPNQSALLQYTGVQSAALRAFLP